MVIWKDIAKRPQYEISNTGEVRNKATQKILKPNKDKDGYLKIDLRYGSRITCRIHRLLAEAFLPDWNENLVVDHIDHNRLNNSLDNLRMLSAEDNHKNKGSKADYLLGQFDKNDNLINSYSSFHDLANTIIELSKTSEQYNQYAWKFFRKENAI